MHELSEGRRKRGSCTLREIRVGETTMDARQLLQAQFTWVHDLINQVISDVPPEILNAQPALETAQSIAAAYAHVALSEDAFVNVMLKKGAPLFAAGLPAAAGVPIPEQPRLTPEWAQQIDMNLEAFRPYVDRVFASTMAYLASASDEELNAEFDMKVLPPMPVAQFLGQVGVTHVANHTGEIAALKGVRGLRGLPF
jgi:uncharacterized damage-inducible protein DinB